MTHLIQELVRDGFIEATIGPITEDIRPVIVAWAKHPPKYENLALLALAKKVSSTGSVGVFVDDVTAKIFTKTTSVHK